MQEHPNAQRIRESLETFNRGDLEGYRDFFNEDVVWYVRGTHPMAGAYRGRDALFDYFQRAREATGGSLHVAPIEIHAGDEYAAVTAHVSGRREGGRTIEVAMTQAFRLDASGRVAEYWALAGDQEAIDEFWSP